MHPATRQSSTTLTYEDCVPPSVPAKCGISRPGAKEKGIGLLSEALAKAEKARRSPER